ncbi:hypothetical protein V8E36_002548 [Tilletia maclaganii]
MIGGHLLHSVYAAVVDYCFPNGGLSNFYARPLLSPADLLVPPLLHLLAIHLLLRYPRSLLSRRLCRFVLLPLTLASGLRIVFGLALEGREGEQQTTKISLGAWMLCYSVIKMGEWSFYPTPKLQKPLMDLERRLKQVEAMRQQHGDGRTRDVIGTTKGGPNGSAVVHGHKAAISADERRRRLEDKEGDDCSDKLALPGFFPGTRIPLELDLFFSFRGIGWNWGPKYSDAAEVDCPLPTPFALLDAEHLQEQHEPSPSTERASHSSTSSCRQTKSQPGGSIAQEHWRASRLRYLRSRFRTLLLYYVLVDLINGFHKSEVLWGVEAGEGAPIIDGVVGHEGFDLGTLSVGGRVVLSITTGFFVVIGTAFLHNILCVLFVLPSVLVRPGPVLIERYTWSDPAHWSPSFVDLRIWRVDSCRTLWADHWHQMLRRCFLVGAYWPVKNGAGWLVRWMSGIVGRRHGRQGSIDKQKDRTDKVMSNSCIAARLVPTAATGVPNPQLGSERRRRYGLSTNGHQHGNGDCTNGDSSSSDLPRRTQSRTTQLLIHALASVSVFLLSGLFHEIIILAAARTPAERSPWRILGLGPELPGLTGALTAFSNHRGKRDRGGGMMLFFGLQGLACVGEDVFERFSGRKVRGVWGSVWTLSCLVLTSFPFAKTWWYYGIPNGPQIDSYTRRMVDWTARSVLDL